MTDQIPLSDQDNAQIKEETNETKEIEKTDENNSNGLLEPESFAKWDELDINPAILRGIYSYGFETPSPIQSKSIISIVKGKDIIAQAQSGTGKTAAFSVGALSRVNVNLKTNQVLILSPTHELTKQIYEVITSLSSSMKNIRIKTMLGKTSIEEDIEALKENTPHIIVGCPGRVYDMIRRKFIKANNLNLVMLDEADEMLSSGFKDQVYNIFQHLNNNVQVALFSATLPPNILQLTNKFMKDPITICVNAESLTLEGIKQYYIALEDDRQKFLTLKDLYQHISVSQCIVYCNSVKRVTDLYEALKDDNFPVTCIHSSMEKVEREKSFKDFRTGKTRVLISSDITARGIDIQQVSVVINFDIPKDIHIYLHRIGRSGRWGRKGTGINFITKKDMRKMADIESYYATQIDELPAEFNLG